MVSALEIFLEYVCPTGGILTANYMFLAPWADVNKAIYKTGKLGDLNPTPWAFMIGNCFGWMFYGILIQNVFVLVANAPGFLLAIYYSLAAVKLQYENHKSSEMRQSLVTVLEKRKDFDPNLVIDGDDSLDTSETENFKSVAKTPTDQHTERHPTFRDYAHLVWEVTAQHQAAPAPHERLTMGMIVVWTAITCIVAMADKVFSATTRENIVGILVNLNLVFFYGAPLSTIMEVLRTQSTRSIHGSTMIANTLNGLFWFAYGLAVLDFFIVVPNGLGALLGGVQILLCAIFPRTATSSKASEADDSDPESTKSGSEVKSLETLVVEKEVDLGETPTTTRSLEI